MDQHRLIRLKKASGSDTLDCLVKTISRPREGDPERFEYGVAVTLRGHGPGGVAGDFWGVSFKTLDANEVLARIKGPSPQFTEYRYYDSAEWVNGRYK